MPIMIFTMLVVLVVAAAVIAVVVMGMQGTGREQHPEIADAMARTARHLNGEGNPPRALVAIFNEADEVSDIDVKQIPGRLRSMASARSARSARSAASANPPERDAVAQVATAEEAAPEGLVPEVAEPSTAVTQALSASPQAEIVAESYGVPGDTVPREAIAEALLAEAPATPTADPYGVLGSTPPGGVQGDTVVRVRLPEPDQQG